MSNLPVVAIVGSRQAGKTTLVHISESEYVKPAVHLFMESDEDLAKLSNAELYFRERSDQHIIIDEIQRHPSLFDLLR